MQNGIGIVGGGIAGQSLAEEVRARDPEIPITLICGEPVAPYDRVRLSELLVEDGVDLTLRPPEWYEDERIELLAGHWVTDIDGGRVQYTQAGSPRGAGADGTSRVFDRIAIATGSDPLLPPPLAGALAYRGPEDVEALRAMASQPGARIAVVGGGLLGLEAARGALALGAHVTVVHLVDRLMERQLDAPAGGLLLDAFVAMGVEVRLEHATEALLPDGRLRFADGSTLTCDGVVVSIGIRPNVALARDIGLEVERGIVVDDHLRTSMPNVIAVGECAQHRGVVYGLVAPIYEQCRIAADTLLGREGRPYEGSLQWAKLKVAGIDLVSIGAAEGPASAAVARPDAYRKLVVAEDGRATGAILLGDVRGAEDLLNAIRSGETVTDPLERLAVAAAATAADLPDDAQVCDCNGVCKGDIAAAVLEGGCKTPREVMARTRAGTGCGTCKTMVKEIVIDVAGGDALEPAYLCPCRQQTREEVAATVREGGLESVGEVSATCGTGRECGACKPALAYLVSEINGNRHREERHARFINDRVHANIQNDGTFSVVPRMYAGVTTPDELRRIADAADKYGARMVKVTGGQRIDLLGIAREDLPGIWRDLDLPSGFAYAKAVRTVKSCVGTDFCRFGVQDSIDLATDMEHTWEHLHTPAKVKAGVSGCPRNCAEATVKDISVVGVEGGWQIRVGGAAGATVREGDVLMTVETKREAMRAMTVFLQFYREEADYLERTYDFVPRVGLDAIRELLADDERCVGLMERFRLAKAAAYDPWSERDKPVHPSQFLEIVGAPA